MKNINTRKIDSASGGSDILPDAAFNGFCVAVADDIQCL